MLSINTAIFSVVNGLLLRALPVAAPEQLALVSTRESIERGYPAGWNYQIWNQIRQRQDRFDGAVVTPGWFETYGMVLQAGRAIDQRDTSGAQPVVVANEAFVKRFLPGHAAVGAIVVDAHAQPGVPSTPLTIVGVGNAVDRNLAFSSSSG